MLALIQHGKQLFHSVALMHVCQVRGGMCAMCADGEAYGNRRPRNEYPDPFPLLSNVPDVPEMTPRYEASLKAELHPYKVLCKLTHLTFEN